MMDEHTFMLNRERAVDYLNMLDRLYVFDGYAGWDPKVLLGTASCQPCFAGVHPVRSTASLQPPLPAANSDGQILLIPMGLTHGSC